MTSARVMRAVGAFDAAGLVAVRLGVGFTNFAAGCASALFTGFSWGCFMGMPRRLLLRLRSSWTFFQPRDCSDWARLGRLGAAGFGPSVFASLARFTILRIEETSGDVGCPVAARLAGVCVAVGKCAPSVTDTVNSFRAPHRFGCWPGPRAGLFQKGVLE